jgi:hypothetical protein
MANNILSKEGITTGGTVETWHVTQSIDAFTGTEPYDITLVGSLDVNDTLLIISDTTVGFGNGGGLLYNNDTTAITIGKLTTALGNSSFSQGLSSAANGNYSHAEGESTISDGVGSHSEGQSTTSTGNYSHAEGSGAQSIGIASHAEGKNTIASGDSSHAEGEGTKAIGTASHTSGTGTIASGSSQTVVGKYNKNGDAKSLFIVGNGSSDGSRSDAFKVTNDNSIIIPTTQSIKPAYSGSDGEIVPATVSGKYFLYMWMNGAWRSGSFI